MPQNSSIHLPGLNGLRAMAALSVLWGHVFLSDFGDWGVKGFSLPVVADGVTLFFVISGFLITFLLLHEQEQSHTVSIPKFYMRRILRIWPIYYLYLLIFGLSYLYCNSNIQLPETVATILIYCIITSATVFVAWLSYKFFESPFLRLKNRYAIIHSQNTMVK